MLKGFVVTALEAILNFYFVSVALKVIRFLIQFIVIMTFMTYAAQIKYTLLRLVLIYLLG